jgi:hypothetical protein
MSARAARLITFQRLKVLSFCHSGIYLVLLALWLGHGPEGVKEVFGWAHGIGWIVMSLLCIVAVRLRVIPLSLAVLVAVIGGIGPFAGTIGFLLAERRRPPAGAAEAGAGRGMV